MKTFEYEYKELIQWYSEELKKVDRISYSGGLDGEHTQKVRTIDSEYRNLLRALKQKYNKTELR